MSIISILSRIANADVNQTGEVAWQGSGGLKSILNDITDTLKSRGVYFIPVNAAGNADRSTMGVLGSADAKILLVEKLGIYCFDPDRSVANTQLDVYAVDGLWKFVSALNDIYIETVGSGNTTYPITHGLGTDIPTIEVWQIATGGNVRVKNAIEKAISIHQVEITFPAATSSNHLIVVKR